MAINIPIVSEFNNAGLKKAQKEFQRLEKTSQKVGFALKKAFVPATAAFGGLAAAAIPAINAASDLEESMSKVGVIFGEGAKEVEAFAETAAKALGQSKQDVLEAAGTFGTFGKAAGLAGTDLAEFSNGMTALASDVASFNNAEPDEVIQAMGAALRGEAEPMRRFGVLLNDATLKAEAMALGIYDGNGALTDQQKILAAQQAIFKQTADAQGDFARTSEGLANQTRIMKAQFENVKAELGAALLPVVLAILPVFSKLADFVGDNTDIVIKLAAAVGGLSAAIIVANIGMKIYTATTAIATAAQWAFNTAVGAIALPIAAVVAFTAALVALERASDKASRTFRILLPGINGISDGISWLQKQTEDVNEELGAWNQTIDEGRRAAGDMYESVREAGNGVDKARGQFERAIGPTQEYRQSTKEAATESKKLAERVDILWSSMDELYRSMFELNPELKRYMDQLDREQAVRDFNDTVAEFKQIAENNAVGSREWEEANRKVYEELINLIETYGTIPQTIQSELKILVDTGQLDAAIAKADRLAEGLRLARAEGSPAYGGGIPSFGDLQAALGGSGFVASTPIAPPVPTISAPAPAAAGAGQNIVVNVSTLQPTPETGRVIVDSIRQANRTSGSSFFDLRPLGRIT